MPEDLTDFKTKEIERYKKMRDSELVDLHNKRSFIDVGLLVIWVILSAAVVIWAVFLGIRLRDNREAILFSGNVNPPPQPVICRDQVNILFQVIRGENDADDYLFIYIPSIDGIVPTSELVVTAALAICTQPGSGRLPVFFYKANNGALKTQTTQIRIGVETDVSAPLVTNFVSYPNNLPLGYVFSQQTVSVENGNMVNLSPVFVLTSTNGQNQILSQVSALNGDQSLTGFSYTTGAAGVLSAALGWAFPLVIE